MSVLSTSLGLSHSQCFIGCVQIGSCGCVTALLQCLVCYTTTPMAVTITLDMASATVMSLSGLILHREAIASMPLGHCHGAPRNVPTDIQFPHRGALYQGEKRLGVLEPRNTLPWIGRFGL